MRQRALPLRSITIATALAVLFVSNASADPILLQKQRQIDGLARVSDIFGGGDEAGFFAFTDKDGTFNETRQLDFRLNGTEAFASSAQATDIGNRAWSGSGTTTARIVRGNPVEQFQQANADSNLAVSFSLQTRTPYQFHGVVNATGNTFQDAQLVLERLGMLAPVFALRTRSDMLEADQSGLLDPGSYRFRAIAESGQVLGLLGTTFGAASFDFDFNLGSPSPTPEPASLILITAGLLGSVARRRRRFGAART